MKTVESLKGSKKAVFTFGRMNPPTRGHEKLINKILEIAKKQNATPYVFLSHTQDPKKNPLTQEQKIKYLNFSISDASNILIRDLQIKNIFDSIKHLEEKGYTDLILVSGADRVQEFSTKIPKYIGHSDPTKALNIESFKVISAGDRDPDSDQVEGTSSSKQRQYVQEDDFTNFFRGVPSRLSEKFAREMFTSIKHGLQLAEEVKSLKKIIKDRS